MTTRRRSSVSFQLHESQFPLQLPQTATTYGPEVGNAASRIRRALPLPLLAFGLGMAAMVSLRTWDIRLCTSVIFHLDTIQGTGYTSFFHYVHREGGCGRRLHLCMLDLSSTRVVKPVKVRVKIGGRVEREAS